LLKSPKLLPTENEKISSLIFSDNKCIQTRRVSYFRRDNSCVAWKSLQGSL